LHGSSAFRTDNFGKLTEKGTFRGFLTESERRDRDHHYQLRIPGEVARESAMMSPTIPI
jgi:hypothetical protein